MEYWSKTKQKKASAFMACGVGPLVLITLLILPGCRGEQMSPAPQDLPDLNVQAMPYITVENTHVRIGPGAQFRTIAEIPANARVHAVGRDGDWLLIVSKKGNAPGYIEMAVVRPEPRQPVRD